MKRTIGFLILCMSVLCIAQSKTTIKETAPKNSAVVFVDNGRTIESFAARVQSARSSVVNFRFSDSPNVALGEPMIETDGSIDTWFDKIQIWSMRYDFAAVEIIYFTDLYPSEPFRDKLFVQIVEHEGHINEMRNQLSD